MHIVDRRLNPSSKSLENRQRFLRRAKALVQGAVQENLRGPRHQGCPARAARSASRSTGCMNLVPSRDGGTRDRCCPATRSSSRATSFRVRAKARGSGIRRPGEGDGEDDFRFVLVARRVRRSVPRRSRIARSRQAQACRCGKRRAAARRLFDLRFAGESLGEPHGAARAGAPHRAAAAAAGDDRAA